MMSVRLTINFKVFRLNNGDHSSNFGRISMTNIYADSRQMQKISLLVCA